MDDLSNSIMNIDIQIESSRQNIEESFDSQSQSIKLSFDTISHKKLEDSRSKETNSKKLGLRIDSIMDCIKSNHTDNASKKINNNPPDTPANIFIHNSQNLSADTIEVDMNQVNLIDSVHLNSIDNTVDIAEPRTGIIEDNSSFINENKSESQEDHVRSLEKSSNNGIHCSLKEIEKKTSNFDESDEEIIDDSKDEEQEISLDIEVYEKEEADEAEEQSLLIKRKPLIDQIKTPDKNKSLNIFQIIKQERALKIEKQLSTNNKFILKLMRKNEYSHIINNINSYYINYHNDSSLNSNLIIPFTPPNDNQLIELENSLKFSFKSIFEFLSNFLNFAKSFRNVLNTSLCHATNFNLFLVYIIKDKLSTLKYSKVTDLNFLELKLRDALKVIKIEDAICGIKSYVEFLLKNLFDSVYKKFLENFNDEFINLSSNLEKIKHTMLHDQISTLKEKFIKYFTLNRKIDFEDKDSTKKSFYIVLMNVKNYFLECFPLCCGSEKIFKKGVNRTSRKLFLCFKCKILICSNCIKYHKSHKYFDLDNFDFKNIEADIVLGEIMENFSHNNSITILDLIEVLLYENFLKTFLTQNFKETKKNFLNEKFLIQSIFSALSKQKYFSFSNEYVDNDNSFITIVEEYKKLISSEQSIKMQNHNLMEEFFINNLSLELNLNKFILNSNPDLNYDVTSTSSDLSLMISQCNSVKEFYRENIKSIKKEKFACVKESIGKFAVGLNKFSTDFKSAGDSRQDSNCEELQMKIKEKLLGLKNNLSTERDENGMLINIIEALSIEDELSKLFIKNDLCAENDSSDSEFKFKDEFVPKLEVVIFFLEDWINKVCSIGVPVFDY